MPSRITVIVVCSLLVAQTAYSQTDIDARYVKELNSGDMRTQFAAAVRLGSFRTTLSATALVKKLTTPEASAVVRSACATSLGKLAVKGTYAFLHNVAKDPKETGLVRASCIKSMAKIKQNEAILDLTTILKTEKSPTVIRSLVEVPGKRTL